MFVSCKQDSKVSDENISQIINNYKERDYVSVNEKSNDTIESTRHVWINSEKDTLTGDWKKSNNAAEYLKVNVIDDTTVYYSFRFMGENGMEQFKGKAYSSLKKTDLEISRRDLQFFHVKKYFNEKPTHTIIISLDTIWHMYAQVNFYDHN